MIGPQLLERCRFWFSLAVALQLALIYGVIENQRMGLGRERCELCFKRVLLHAEQISIGLRFVAQRLEDGEARGARVSADGFRFAPQIVKVGIHCRQLVDEAGVDGPAELPSGLGLIRHAEHHHKRRLPAVGRQSFDQCAQVRDRLLLRGWYKVHAAALADTDGLPSTTMNRTMRDRSPAR